MAASPVPPNGIQASIAQASSMSTVGLDLSLIPPFIPRPGTYGHAINALWPSPYMCPQWIRTWRDVFDQMRRRWVVKTKNQLTADMLALFTMMCQETSLLGTGLMFSRMPDFMVDRDLSVCRGVGGPAYFDAEMAWKVRMWRRAEPGVEVDLIAAMALGPPIVARPEPQSSGSSITSHTSAHSGYTVRPLLDSILRPAMSIIVTNEYMPTAFLQDDPKSSRAQKKSRLSSAQASTTQFLQVPSPSPVSPATAFVQAASTRPLSPWQVAGAKRRREDSAPPVPFASIAYVHASETQGQVNEAVAARALTTAVLQVLSAFEACGTFLGSSSCFTRWLRILALRSDHVIIETVNVDDAFKTVPFTDLLRHGEVFDLFAWDLVDSEQRSEPDMETIEQIWLALYAGIRIAAEWPLDGPIPWVASVGVEQNRWLDILDLTASHARNTPELSYSPEEPGYQPPDRLHDAMIRRQVAAALGIDISTFTPSQTNSPDGSSLPRSAAVIAPVENDTTLWGESAEGYRMWQDFFFSHPDLVALFARLDIKVTFVTPSYLDRLIIERIPGYRARRDDQAGDDPTESGQHAAHGSG